MDIAAIRDEIKLRLTGGLLEIELDDSTIDRLIQSCMRELQRYICSTKLVTVPFSKCIDMADYQVNSVARVYRAAGFTDSDESGPGTISDPMQASLWQIMSGSGNMYNFQNYIYNYGAWNTLLKIRNTTSTDLAFRYDKSSEKLYINICSNHPSSITIEYVPRYNNVEEIKSDYWIDILVRMCIATAKITVGRIRTRYTQSGALWSQDGDRMIEEGNRELSELREHLATNTQLCYPID